MTTTAISKRLAAAAVTGALVAGAALLTAAPAHAGAYCTVVPHDAPIFEHADPDSRVVHRIDAGTTVAGTRTGTWSMWRVSRADNHVHLGFMKPSHLYCHVG